MRDQQNLARQQEWSLPSGQDNEDRSSPGIRVKDDCSQEPGLEDRKNVTTCHVGSGGRGCGPSFSVCMLRT